MTETNQVKSKIVRYHRPKPEKGKYRFFCTGTIELLYEGFDVTLDPSFTPEDCKNYLMEEIKQRIEIQKGDLIVYVACGIPFVQGTIGDVYCNDECPQVSRYIYGVLTSPLAHVDLNNNYHELCNINDETRKILLSPFSESTVCSLCSIGCLLGYQNHDGQHSNEFERSLGYCLHFPPLHTSMRRVIDRYEVTGRDVITISSALFTFFRHLNPVRVKSEEVFESTFKCSNAISGLENVPEKFPVCRVELSPQLESDKTFLTKIVQGRYAYVWKEDIEDEEFASVYIKKLSVEEFDEMSSKSSMFTPIAPLSILVATSCSIVRGKEHSFLYLKQSSDKDKQSQNNVDIIDPTTGFVDSKDVYEFSKEQEDPNGSGHLSVVDASEIKQVIMIAIDESANMKKPFKNRKRPKMTETETETDKEEKGKEEEEEEEIEEKEEEDEGLTYEVATIQYLSIFLNRLYGYRIPCIVGVISFNDEARYRVKLTPFIPDIEEELKDFSMSGEASYKEALSKSIDELLKFTISPTGDRLYENAVSRIIMITTSETKVEIDESTIELTRKLVDNNISFDSFVFGTENCMKELITVSHISRGLTFNATNMSEGLALFEKSAFLDYTERDLSHHNHQIIPGDRSTSATRLKPEMITETFLREGSIFSEFDPEVRNRYIYRATVNSRLSTPRHMVNVNRDDQISNKRFRRILRELFYVSKVMDEDSDEFDPDLVVLTYSTNLDNWMVFLKGTEGTIYAGKWYELYITFPDTYPISPPVVRFMSIPYHLNISSEGRICLNIVEKGYTPTCRVLNIIQEVKELFIIPNTDTPIQIEILQTFMNDQEKYKEKARKSAQKVGKDNYEEFFPKRTFVQGLSDDEDESNIGLDYDRDRTPLFMISNIIGDQIRDPVLASSGVFYDREELRQILESFHGLSDDDSI